MKLEVCAAVDEDVALGLNLAGVEEILIWENGNDISELRSWYRRILEKDYGVMILSHECGEALHHELFEKRAQGIMMPVTVMIPGPGEDKRAKDLIKRAVGMDPERGAESDDKIDRNGTGRSVK
ncbi:MAG: V-type ATP synthase subunit F [Thermoplasmatota archaeon]